MESDIDKAISALANMIGNPTQGLPEAVFLFVSSVTPLVNVDLLIQNEKNETLLTWRDDGLCPAAWHVPGGVIRYKETLSDRIHAVGAVELGAEVSFKKDPVALNEVTHPSRSIRGHFISLLYECTLTSPPDEHRRHRQGIPQAGNWAWHAGCPVNLLSVHEKMYRQFIDNTAIETK